LRVRTELVIEVAVLAVGIAAIAAAHSRAALLCLLLVLIGAAVATFWRTGEDLIFFTIGAVIGPVAEVVCVHFQGGSTPIPCSWASRCGCCLRGDSWPR